MLKNYDSNLILFPDNHPNELGHKLIANILYEQLLKTNQDLPGYQNVLKNKFPGKF